MTKILIISGIKISFALITPSTLVIKIMKHKIASTLLPY